MLAVFKPLTGKAPNPRKSYGRMPSDAAERIAPALTAVQQVVDAMTDHKSGRYIVCFSEVAEASTDFKHRKMVVSAKPFLEGKLTLAQACEVVTGLAAHEIGHDHIGSEALNKRVAERWPKSRLALKVQNLIDDVALEALMSERYPGIGTCFRPTMTWMGKQSLPKKPIRHWPGSTLTDRFNFAIAAVRYFWLCRWLADGATRNEREWWQVWAGQYGVTDPDVRMEGIAQAIERLREPVYEDVDDQAESSEPDEPQQGDEDEGEDGQGGPGHGLEDEDDESGSDDGDEDEDGAEGAPELGNEPGEGKPTSGEGKPEPSDGNADPDRSTDAPALSESKGDTPGGGTEQYRMRDESELPEPHSDPYGRRKSEVIEDVDDLRDKTLANPWNGRDLQRQIDADKRAVTVRRTDGWGHIRVEETQLD